MDWRADRQRYYRNRARARRPDDSICGDMWAVFAVVSIPMLLSMLAIHLNDMNIRFGDRQTNPQQSQIVPEQPARVYTEEDRAAAKAYFSNPINWGPAHLRKNKNLPTTKKPRRSHDPVIELLRKRARTSIIPFPFSLFFNDYPMEEQHRSEGEPTTEKVEVKEKEERATSTTGNTEALTNGLDDGEGATEMGHVTMQKSTTGDIHEGGKMETMEATHVEMDQDTPTTIIHQEEETPDHSSTTATDGDGGQTEKWTTSDKKVVNGDETTIDEKEHGQGQTPSLQLDTTTPAGMLTDERTVTDEEDVTVTSTYDGSDSETDTTTLASLAPKDTIFSESSEVAATSTTTRAQTSTSEPRVTTTTKPETVKPTPSDANTTSTTTEDWTTSEPRTEETSSVSSNISIVSNSTSPMSTTTPGIRDETSIDFTSGEMSSSASSMTSGEMTKDDSRTSSTLYSTEERTSETKTESVNTTSTSSSNANSETNATIASLLPKDESTTLVPQSSVHTTESPATTQEHTQSGATEAIDTTHKDVNSTLNNVPSSADQTTQETSTQETEWMRHQENDTTTDEVGSTPKMTTETTHPGMTSTDSGPSSTSLSFSSTTTTTPSTTPATTTRGPLMAGFLTVSGKRYDVPIGASFDSLYKEDFTAAGVQRKEVSVTVAASCRIELTAAPARGPTVDMVFKYLDKPSVQAQKLDLTNYRGFDTVVGYCD